MLQQLNELPYDELVDLLKQVTDIKLAAAEIANTFDRSDCRAFVDVVDTDIIKLMIDEVSEHTIIECVTKSPEVVTIISNSINHFEFDETIEEIIELFSDDTIQSILSHIIKNITNDKCFSNVHTDSWVVLVQNILEKYEHSDETINAILAEYTDVWNTGYEELFTEFRKLRNIDENVKDIVSKIIYNAIGKNL